MNWIDQDVQERVVDFLREIEIFVNPEFVIYVSQKTQISPLLKISFYRETSEIDIKDLEKLLEVDTMCDNSGFTSIPDNSTVILSGMILVKFFKLLDAYEARN